MAYVAFGGQDEAYPSTSNGNKYKLPTTLLDGCCEVNHASVPKKLRSAIKKRGREDIVSPLPIQRKRKHIMNGVNTHREDGTKKSKLNMRRGHITKDEEEVAEALYALAGMFSDEKRTDQSPSEHEQPETKSSAIPEERSLNNEAEGEESKKISLKVTPKAADHASDLMDSTARILKSQSLGAQEVELFLSKEPPTLSSCGVQSGSNLSPRPFASLLGIAQLGELEDGPSVVQCVKNYLPVDDKCKDTFLPPNLSTTRTSNSETQISCPRLPAWFDSTSVSTQPCVIDNNITTEKYTGVAIESKKLLKRCTAHVYISRLIKVLQISDVKEVLPPEKPTQSTPCGGAEQRPHNQITVINGRNHSSAQMDSSEIQNDTLLHKMPVRDQNMASQTTVLHSTKQGYDFLSLGTRLDSYESVNGDGPSCGPRKQYNMPSYVQSQNHSAVLFSLPQNGYSSIFHSHTSALAAQQVPQLPQHHSSSFIARTGQPIEPHRHKWAAQQYNTGGGGVPLNPHSWKNGERESASILNYAHALFPHLHAAALGPNYQQFSPSHEQTVTLNTSLPFMNMNGHHLHLPLEFERNGTVFGPDNIKQLQLPCNHHL